MLVTLPVLLWSIRSAPTDVVDATRVTQCGDDIGAGTNLEKFHLARITCTAGPQQHSHLSNPLTILMMVRAMMEMDCRRVATKCYRVGLGGGEGE